MVIKWGSGYTRLDFTEDDLFDLCCVLEDYLKLYKINKKECYFREFAGNLLIEIYNKRNT